MFSNLPPTASPDPRRILLSVGFGVLVLSAFVLAGCGKKGPPLPPLRYVPATTQDLRVSQQGAELVFQLAYPARSTGGLSLPDLARVELWSAARPRAAEEAATTAPQPMDPRQFALAARLERALAGRDLSESVRGDRLVFRVPVPEGPADASQDHFYAIRSVVSERDVSEFSNQAALTPGPPPPPPTGVATVAQEAGIEVRWEAAVPTGETPEPAAMGFNIYRRAGEASFWGDPLYTAGTGERSWTDRGARFGERYTYGVALIATRRPLVESSPAEAPEIAYLDRFPPPPPRDLVALAETGRVRLVWESAETPDLAGFHIYRHTESGDWIRRTEAPENRREYVDRDLTAGASFTYRVTAVDREGNESEPTAEVAATVR